MRTFGTTARVSESQSQWLVVLITIVLGGSRIFRGCKSLKIVKVAKGCTVNVRKLVGFFVKVR